MTSLLLAIASACASAIEWVHAAARSISGIGPLLRGVFLEDGPTPTPTVTCRVTAQLELSPISMRLPLLLLIAPALSSTVPLASRTAAVAGAGPAGLCTAIMLARRGWGSITVYDELAAPPTADDAAWGAGERSYQLGLNGRGQTALRTLGCMDRVSRYAASANGRLSFDKDGAPVESRLTPPGEPGAEKNYVTRVLQRDRLQAALLEEVHETYSDRITIVHGATCGGVDLDGAKPCILIARGNDEEATRMGPVDLLVGADGVRSSVRKALEDAPGSRTRAVRYPEINERRFKTLPLHPSLVPGTSADLNWGYRNTSLDLGMDALPTMEGEMVAVVLTKPGTAGYEQLNALASAEDARAFFSEVMPPLLPYLKDDELERFTQRPIGRLPSFQKVEGDIHKSLAEGGVVLLGDAIKAVKPCVISPHLPPPLSSSLRLSSSNGLFTF